MTEFNSASIGRWLINAASSVLVCVLLAACSTSGSSTDATRGDGAAAQASGFALDVLEDTYYSGGAAEFGLRLSGDERVSVEINASGASGLKAAYFELRYDPAVYSPLGVSGALDQVGQALELAVLDQPGVVSSGQVLIHPDTRAGFSGSGTLATVTFARTPFPAARAVSTPPDTAASQALLALDKGTGTLNWGYYCQGDYNQDRLTGISDLTPLGVHFGTIGGPFPANEIRAVVDGDGNGQINIADITPIGANFGKQVAEYRIYESLSLSDLPASNNAPSSISELATLPYESFVGDRAVARVQYTFIIAAPTDLAHYWVRPGDGTDEGTPSTTVQYDSGAGGNNAPVADLTTDVQTGPAPLDVFFDAAASTDPDAGDSISKFEFDFDGDGAFDLDNGTNSTVNHTYAVDGIFSAAVRVTDSGTPALTGTDVVTITVTPGTGNLPPTVSLDANPTSGDAALLVAFDATANDPDGTVATYEWDWTDDGNFDVSGAVNTGSHNYTQPGNFTARVRVTDNGGATAEDTVGITVTGTPPATHNIPGYVLQWDSPLGQSSHGLNGFTVECYRVDDDSFVASAITGPGPLDPPNDQGYFTLTNIPEDDGSTGGYYLVIVEEPPSPETAWNPPTFSIFFLTADWPGASFYDANGF